MNPFCCMITDSLRDDFRHPPATTASLTLLTRPAQHVMPLSPNGKPQPEQIASVEPFRPVAGGFRWTNLGRRLKVKSMKPLRLQRLGWSVPQSRFTPSVRRGRTPAGKCRWTNCLARRNFKRMKPARRQTLQLTYCSLRLRELNEIVYP